MNTWLIWASIGACGTGAVLAVIAIGWLLDWRSSRPVERGGAHRADEPLPGSRGVADWTAAGSPKYAALAQLDASPVEVIWTLAAEIEERTEEMPAPVEETPVEHHGADEDWSPTQELEMVPARPLDPIEAMEAEIEEEVRREIARIFDPIEAALARIGHAEQDTCEISFAHLQLAIAAERSGAL